MLRDITSKTEVLAVIGDPISHSLSPKIHNFLYQEQGIDAIYLAAHVKSGALDLFMKNLPTLNWRGFNVTMPHKISIKNYLTSGGENEDGCNTVRVNGEKIEGTSTDGEGFFEGLRHEDIAISGSKVALLGAGAVVKTIAKVIWQQKPQELRIINRTKEKAEAIAAMLGDGAKGVSAHLLCNESICDSVAGCDVLVNATPMGMTGCPDQFESFGFLRTLNRGAAVADLIYSPRQTQLLLHAQSLGMKRVNGLGMLVGQALKAHEYWFGVSSSKEMFERVLSRLEAL